MTTTHDDKAREREQFEKQFPTLNFSMAHDAWGRSIYLHSHVQALWDGWQARAALSPASTGQEADWKLTIQRVKENLTLLFRNHIGARWMPSDRLLVEESLDAIADPSFHAWLTKEAREERQALAAPAQQVEAEKWISVTERLPEEMKEVLVWEQWSTNPFVGYWTGNHWDVDKEHYDIGGVWANGYVEGKVSQDCVTHWMPLPKPPAAGSNNGEKS